jgi:hypothetical protein
MKLVHFESWKELYVHVLDKASSPETVSQYFTWLGIKLYAHFLFLWMANTTKHSVHFFTKQLHICNWHNTEWHMWCHLLRESIFCHHLPVKNHNVISVLQEQCCNFQVPTYKIWQLKFRHNLGKNGQITVSICFFLGGGGVWKLYRGRK